MIATAPPPVSLLCTTALAGPGTVIRLRAVGAGGNGWTEDVQRPTGQLIELVNAHVQREPRGPLLVVVTVSAGEGGLLEQALVRSAGGIVDALAQELGPEGDRVGLVVTSSATHPGDIDLVESYLLDTARSGAPTGITVDLRSHPVVDRSTGGVVLVTGGAGAVGHAAARSVLRDGRRVVLTDLPGAGLERAATQLGVPSLACDLADPDDIARLAESPELDALDGLVVHHGIGGSTRFGDDYDRSGSELSLAHNGTAVYDLVRALRQRMELGGSIVVLSPPVAAIAARGDGATRAARLAVLGYVEALSRRLAGQGVTVQGLCPTPGADPASLGTAASVLLRLRSTGVVLTPTGSATLD